MEWQNTAIVKLKKKNFFPIAEIYMIWPLEHVSPVTNLGYLSQADDLGVFFVHTEKKSGHFRSQAFELFHGSVKNLK